MYAFTNFKERYISYRDNILEDFYKPAVSVSISYDRMAGYFSSSFIDTLYNEIYSSIYNHDFKIRLICSPQLSDDDINKIKEGYEFRKIFQDNIINNIEEIKEINKKFPYITKLIVQGNLDIKFATTQNGEGIFHAKEGIFTDFYNNKVGFLGSSNETLAALKKNFETTSVYLSDKDPEMIKDMEETFEKLWNNEMENLNILGLTPEIIDKFKDVSSSPLINEDKVQYGRKTIRAKYRLHDYQEKAINEWENNNYIGLLEMATGTGKTVTALACHEKILKQKPHLVTIIVAPQLELVNQWAEELINLDIDAIKCSSTEKNYLDKLKVKLTLESDFENPLVIITTSQTFILDKFQNILDKFLKREALLICDEVHSFGSDRIRKLFNKLEALFNYRLGVSATPFRKNDEESQLLIKFFDRIIFTYDLKDAIKNGYLNRYVYYPIILSFTNEELNQYRSSVSKDINNITDIYSNAIKLKQIDRITSSIANSNIQKVQKLKDILTEERIKDPKIIYCSPGNYNDGESVIDDKHINIVGRELGQHGCKLRKVSSLVDTEKRKETLELFKAGDIDTLLAIKCLDQGVNLKEVTHAYILSSTDSLTEFIQRRGRILRTAPNKPTSVIYDFIMLPEDIDSLLFNPQLNDSYLVDRELRRMEEFNNAAENFAENIYIIDKIKFAYQDVLEELNHVKNNK